MDEITADVCSCAAEGTVQDKLAKAMLGTLAGFVAQRLVVKAYDTFVIARRV